MFGDYSSGSLLLAADVDGRRVSTLDDELDDDLTADDANSIDKHPGKTLLDESVATSLDALQRERAAIDEVLAELHEVKLSPQKQTQDSTTTDSGRNRDSGRNSDQTFFSADAQRQMQGANSQADGGMVMLAASGDPNSGAYDLTAVLLSELQVADAQTFVVEASVGLYQAVDVGTRESRPAQGDTLPIAQPTSASQPSVSAENAPAKKGEQPS